MRNALIKIAVPAALACGVLATAPAFAQDYPAKPIVMILPNDPGGTTDRLARILVPHLSKELGVPVTVENKPGAQSLVGNAYWFNQPADGHTLLYTALPYVINNIENQGAPFKMEDMGWINIPEAAQTVIFAHKNTPYKNMEELTAALKERGKVSAGVIGGSSEHILALLLMDKLGVPRENLRLVTYDGGGTARTAISGGQVDIALLPGQGSEQVLDFANPLAVVGEKALPGFDAPPVNEALTPVGIELPLLPSSLRVILTHRKFADEQPENFKKLVAAFEKVNNSAEFQEQAKNGKLGAGWTGPEEAARIIDNNYKLLIEHRAVLEN